MFKPTGLPRHIVVFPLSRCRCIIIISINLTTCNIYTVKVNVGPFTISPLHTLVFCLVQPYLKSWSQDLGVPILSVDYSLAPDAPFPRALEECFYAYCWALRNHHLLGTSYSIVFYQNADFINSSVQLMFKCQGESIYC